MIPTVKMAQLVSAGETTLYFQKENFPQLSAGLSVNSDIVAPIMIVPPSNMQSSYFLIEKLCAWVCLEGCLGIELCLGVCRRGFLNTDRANRPSSLWPHAIETQVCQNGDPILVKWGPNRDPRQQNGDPKSKCLQN